MTANRNRLLRSIMELDFTATDLNLYLDTHPTDERALKMFNEVSDKVKELTDVYEKEFGPLTPSGNKSTKAWTWIDDPWPWEY